MKLLHFSDTHLGFSDFDILNSNNINQREADFYDAFLQIVEAIKYHRPDYIIHTGDLFHRSSPSNRAIAFALEQFKIIDDLNIPCIIIAGNHSTPRTTPTTPILKIFDTYKNIYTSYNQSYKKIEFLDVVFHTLPHMHDETKAISQIKLCEENHDKTKKNIMLMHCSVGAYYLMEEFGEWCYPKEYEYIFKMMDYVALGHWHSFSQVKNHKNTYYCGSTEKTSLNDKKNSKGYIIASIDKGFNILYNEINTRKILYFEIDCNEYDTSINNLDLSNIKDSIIDVKLINLTPTKSIDISNNDIKNIFYSALYINIKREFVMQDNTNRIDDIESKSIEEYFISHIKDNTETNEAQRLIKKIEELFSSYEEENRDTE